jgi:hypothetical protein
LPTVGQAAGARPLEPDLLRGEKVGWARLKTPNEFWMRHTRSDPTMAAFLRENTSLNIDPTWYVADIADLDSLVKFPFLYASDIQQVESPIHLKNLHEYLARGGFIFVDACINLSINPSPDGFLEGQRQALSAAWPETTVVPLGPDHPVLNCYLPMPKGLPHTYDHGVYSAKWAAYGLYGILVKEKMIGMISMAGLQCGWDRMPAPAGHDIQCMRMMANIYVYAMAYATT